MIEGQFDITIGNEIDGTYDSCNKEFKINSDKDSIEEILVNFLNLLQGLGYSKDDIINTIKYNI